MDIIKTKQVKYVNAYDKNIPAEIRKELLSYVTESHALDISDVIVSVSELEEIIGFEDDFSPKQIRRAKVLKTWMEEQGFSGWEELEIIC